LFDDIDSKSKLSKLSKSLMKSNLKANGKDDSIGIIHNDENINMNSFINENLSQASNNMKNLEPSCFTQSNIPLEESINVIYQKENINYENELGDENNLQSKIKLLELLQLKIHRDTGELSVDEKNEIKTHLSRAMTVMKLKLHDKANADK